MAFYTLLFVYFICLIRFKFPEDRKNTSFVLIIPWSFVYSSSQEIQKKCVHSTFFLNIKADPGISLVVQRLRLWAPNVGGLASIPGQETRCHIPQWKIPHAATKTRHSRIKKKKKGRSRWRFNSLHFSNSVWSEVRVSQSCPTLWDLMDYTVHGISLGQNTGVGSLSLLQGIFPTEGLNPGLPHCRQILYQLSHEGSPIMCMWNEKHTFPALFLLNIRKNFM